MNIVAARTVAFGNGTRPKGFAFATVEFKGDSKLFDLHLELRDKTPIADLKSATVTLADGVLASELATAVSNSRTIRLEAETKPNDAGSTKPVEPVEWRTIEIKSVSNVTKKAKTKLAEAKILTLGDLEKHTAENEGFNDELSLTKKEQSAICLLYTSPSPRD